ncbi:MAG: hypothetical protein HY858_11300 [Candidatus Solibacter usitatus]|nr:hypothetical protein [Candidatus Solibacter usitatus]
MRSLFDEPDPLEPSPTPLLVAATFIYLAFPLSLFLTFWLRWYLALPACIALSVALIPICGRLSSSAAIPHLKRWALNVLAALLLAAIPVALSGVGGFGRQNHDFPKHNGILLDLTEGQWPVYYSLPGSAEPVPLDYYSGWYLPAALVGKAAGWTAANYALAAWTVIGLALALLLFRRLAGVSLPAAWLLIVCWAGLREFGRLILFGHPWPGDNEGRYWTLLWNAPGALADFHWTPGHLLAGWLSALVLLSIARDKSQPAAAALLLVLTAFWSPFVAIGLAPFVALVLRPHRTVAPALLLALILALYFHAHEPGTAAGWMSSFYDWPSLAITYSWFILLEYLLLALLLVPFRHFLPRPWFWTAVTLLALAPLYRIGIHFDLQTHASRPALAFLLVTAAAALRSSGLPGAGGHRLVLVLVIALGSLDSLRWAMSSLSHYRLGPPPQSWVARLPQQSAEDIYNAQYRGLRHALFFRLLAPPPSQPLTLKPVQLDLLQPVLSIHRPAAGFSPLEHEGLHPILWSLGPESTVSALQPPGARLTLHLAFRWSAPGQTLSVSLDGRDLRQYRQPDSPDGVTDSIPVTFPGGLSRIALTPNLWNRQPQVVFPGDSRPLAILFTELRLVEVPR